MLSQLDLEPKSQGHSTYQKPMTYKYETKNCHQHKAKNC